MNARTNRVYVANLYNSTVSVIDGNTDTVIDTIPIDSQSFAPNGGGPSQVAIDEDANILYVLTNNGTISVVDGKTDKVLSSFIFDSDGGGFEGLVTPTIVRSKKTGKLYVQNDNFRIDVIDPKSQKVIKYIADDQAGPLTINQRTNTIYITNAWAGTVWAIDGDTDQVTKVIGGVGVPAVPTGCWVTGTCTVGGSVITGDAVDESFD